MQTAEELLKEAQTLNEVKKYDEVIELLSDEILATLQKADLYVEKAQAYWRLNRFDFCAIEVDKALLIDDQNYKANKYRGHLAAEEIDYHSAVEYYKKALKKKPNNAELQWLIGDAFSRLNDYEAAKKYLNKSLKINKENPGAYNGLGNLNFHQKNFKQAILFYQEAIKIKPNEADFYYNIALSYQNLKDYSSTIKFYSKAIEIKPNYLESYYNRASIYKITGNYKASLADYTKYLNIAPDSDDYLKRTAQLNITELEDLIKNPNLTFINELVGKIKELLLYKDNCITHYTSFSAAYALIIKDSLFRLSEGTYLNDTSEGRELFNFLPNLPKLSLTLNETVAKQFITKPFIGSFVAEAKHDDLTLWRMYGKENKEEAKGCALTLDRELFLDSLRKILIPDGKASTTNAIDEAFSFYRVAYRKQELEREDYFIIPGASNDEKTLNELMVELRKKLKKVFDEKSSIISVRNWSELSQIAFLFKSAEYQYEHELRLIVKGTAIDKKISEDLPPKVYIELIKINPLIRKITFGPKVEKADEWASAFYYTLDKQGFYPDIFISHLPFK